MENKIELEKNVKTYSEKLNALQNELNQVILDQDLLIEQFLIGVLAGGHILLEGLPGLGKTELVKAFSSRCGINFSRVQFTPDLLPGDITGNYILEEKDGKRDFVFKKGPVFTNLLLGDEINRASPKTQSALLEAMQEKNVTVLGKTFRLDPPFFVLATQNPIELEGTYPLPEAQVDRFMMKLFVKRPNTEALKTIIKERKGGLPPIGSSLLSREELANAMDVSGDIYIADAVASYISRLIDATHPDSQNAPEIVKQYVKYGASPRAGISIASAIRARAMIKNRQHAGFKDIQAVFHSILNHRMQLDYRARIDGISTSKILNTILDEVSETEKPLPHGVA